MNSGGLSPNWAKDYGYRCGEMLEPARQGLSFVERRLAAELRKQRQVLLMKLASLRGAASEQAGRVGAAEKERALLEERLALHEGRRQEQPEQYSLFRAWLYGALGAMFLAADFPIAGEVLSSSLGLSFRVDEVEPFRQLFLKNPLKSFWEYPDLTTMSVAVLSLGLLLEVFSDDYLDRANWNSRVLAAIRIAVSSTALVLALATIFLVAYVRSTLLEQAQAGVSIQWLLVLFGVAFPVLAAVCFVRAIRPVGRRYLLWRYSVANWWVSRRLRRLSEQSTAAAATLASIEQEGAALEVGTDDYRDRLGVLRLEFRDGYARGIENALARGNLFDKLEGVALRELFRGEHE